MALEASTVSMVIASFFIAPLHRQNISFTMPIDIILHAFSTV